MMSRSFQQKSVFKAEEPNITDTITLILTNYILIKLNINYCNLFAWHPNPTLVKKCEYGRKVLKMMDYIARTG